MHLCQDNFKRNRLTNGAAYVGDLFQATSKLTTWPKYSYLYPPQIRGNPDETDEAGPGVSLYVDNEYTLFKRIAQELPPLYVGQGVLWLGVDWELVATVADIFRSNGWVVPDIETLTETNLPSVLLKMELDVLVCNH